jgi:hypothetical protein
MINSDDDVELDDVCFLCKKLECSGNLNNCSVFTTNSRRWQVCCNSFCDTCYDTYNGYCSEHCQKFDNEFMELYNKWNVSIQYNQISTVKL